MVFALLWQAVKETAKGNGEAAEWLAGEESQHWADLLGLERWPPKPGQWSGFFVGRTWRNRAR